MAPVKSAERALDILDLLASIGKAMTHAELGRRTGMPFNPETLKLVLDNEVKESGDGIA